MANSKTVIIAGMHRSGTSLTASLLQQSGLFIGDNLLANGFDNKNGHFEDNVLLNLHESDLKRKKLDTRGLKNIPDLPLSFDEKTKKQIETIITNRTKYQLWGWKEPRTTLYLNAWKKILPDSKCIGVFRDFDEVVDSIVRRYTHKIKNGVGIGGFTRLKHRVFYPINIFFIKRNAYRSWKIYNTRLLEFKKTYPDDAIVVELNHFLENYNDVLEVINQQFAINLSKIDVSDLYEPSLLANKKKKESRLRLFSHTKLQSTMKALKEQSLWI